VLLPLLVVGLGVVIILWLGVWLGDVRDRQLRQVEAVYKVRLLLERGWLERRWLERGWLERGWWVVQVLLKGGRLQV